MPGGDRSGRGEPNPHGRQGFTRCRLSTILQSRHRRSLRDIAGARDEDVDVVDVEDDACRAVGKTRRGDVQDDPIRLEQPATPLLAKPHLPQSLGDGRRHVADEIEIVGDAIRSSVELRRRAADEDRGPAGRIQALEPRGERGRPARPRPAASAARGGR